VHRRQLDLRPPGKGVGREADGEQESPGGEGGRGTDGVDQPTAVASSDWNLGFPRVLGGGA
jgi:hypothetical protein